MSEQDDGEVAHLEKFDAPNRSHVATFETDELTALCPFDFGGPDHYQLILRYEPADVEIESKSLKQYLEAFRSREITAEALAVEIADDVEQTIAPERLYIRLEQARRGGIEETVEVGDVDLR